MGELRRDSWRHDLRSQPVGPRARVIAANASLSGRPTTGGVGTVCSHDTSCEPEIPNIDATPAIEASNASPDTRRRWLLVARAGRDLAKMSSVEQKLAINLLAKGQRVVKRLRGVDLDDTTWIRLGQTATGAGGQ